MHGPEAARSRRCPRGANPGRVDVIACCLDPDVGLGQADRTDKASFCQADSDGTVHFSFLTQGLVGLDNAEG